GADPVRGPGQSRRRPDRGVADRRRRGRLRPAADAQNRAPRRVLSLAAPWLIGGAGAARVPPRPPGGPDAWSRPDFPAAPPCWGPPAAWPPPGRRRRRAR